MGKRDELKKVIGEKTPLLLTLRNNLRVNEKEINVFGNDMKIRIKKKEVIKKQKFSEYRLKKMNQKNDQENQENTTTSINKNNTKTNLKKNQDKEKRIKENI